MEGQNVALIVIAAVVPFMIAAVTLYLLVAFQHPEDRNQAWFPKAVVCLSLSVAIATVLLFPLDVANRRACTDDVLFSECDWTLPMRTLWYTVYITNICLVYVVTPFTVFYYEADSDAKLWQRVKSGVLWTCLFVLIFGGVLAIVWALGGYVEYDTTLLRSGMISVGDLATLDNTCILPSAGSVQLQGQACNAFATPQPTSVQWSVRTNFLVYAVAVASILGWLLFMVFGGVGIVALPLDMIMRFHSRPTKTLTKSEYIAKAKDIGALAQRLAASAVSLKKAEQSDGRSRKWRSQYKALNQEINSLEDDQRELEKQFPQGEDRDAVYVFYILGFYLSLVGGILFLCVALSWIIHIVLYMLVKPPAHPFLNTFFTELDDVFPLFGVAAFALWCFFLILAAIKGFTKLGLNFGFISLYPMKANVVTFCIGMATRLSQAKECIGSFALHVAVATPAKAERAHKPAVLSHIEILHAVCEVHVDNFSFTALAMILLGATLMSSLLVNTALILLTSSAIIQFCASAFAAYAAETAIWEIFGTDIDHLRYIRHIFRSNVFIWVLLSFSVISVVWIIVRGPSVQRRGKKSLEEIYAS